MKNLSLFLAILLKVCALSAQNSPKNIILLIGDGMGLSQISSGVYASNHPLNLERFRHLGLIKTHSLDNLITDSAAGATAFATGKKTYNGAIAVDENGQELTTILEIAHARNLGTGVIATSTIQHATPASFYAHHPERTEYEEITLDFLNGNIDIAIGGGLRLFKKRKDNRDLVKEMEQQGYTFYKDIESAAQSPSDKMMVITHKGHIPSIKSGRGNYLANASILAMNHLNTRKDGFILVIEGSQIDWGGHSNDGQYIINEMLDFDQTIGKVLDFAEKDGETLVIVTADHETGGFSILGKNDKGELETSFTTGNHTATLIPVFAYGPGAETFMGIYDNTRIFNKMYDALGLGKISQGAANR